ncbi:MAG: GatB/YqeY domain-containing protein [Anaerolineae bacterium]|nr:GatB/YqeY domain-containing protein [Anaerolineae bacterium]
MGLEEQLHEDLRSAMRAQDAPRKSAIRMVLASIQLSLVDKPDGLSDGEVLELIRREVKRREEAVELMQSAGRHDLISGELIELDILKGYLPTQLGEAEIRVAAQAVIDQLGASSLRDMGRVMGALMPQVTGRADGRLVNQVVRDLLSA